MRRINSQCYYLQINFRINNLSYSTLTSEPSEEFYSARQYLNREYVDQSYINESTISLINDSWLALLPDKGITEFQTQQIMRFVDSFFYEITRVKNHLNLTDFLLEHFRSNKSKVMDLLTTISECLHLDLETIGQVIGKKALDYKGIDFEPWPAYFELALLIYNEVQ